MKRITGILLCICLIMGSGTFAMADAGEGAAKPAQAKAMAYLKPDIKVLLRGDVERFFDVKGKEVYPILYNSSTYLPVRAVSAIMGENVEWDNYSRTVFIGKTLSNPNKSKAKQENELPWVSSGEDKQESESKALPSENEAPALITVHIKPNFTIMYDFRIQQFVDARGDITYPLIYEGSVYLPIRAVSQLMGEEITWDKQTNTVAIGKKDENTPGMIPERPQSMELAEFFEKQIELYDEATDKITGIKAAKTDEALTLLAAAVSADYNKAQLYNIELKTMERNAFNSEELSAYSKMCAFAEASEYYILVLENIAYMAAEKADYSVLAETFLNFAMDSSAKLDEARDGVEALQR